MEVGGQESNGGPDSLAGRLENVAQKLGQKRETTAGQVPEVFLDPRQPLSDGFVNGDCLQLLAYSLRLLLYDGLVQLDKKRLRHGQLLTWDQRVPLPHPAGVLDASLKTKHPVELLRAEG